MAMSMKMMLSCSFDVVQVGTQFELPCALGDDY